ncbi:MAG TPA: hypothetical protein VHM92_04685, partial [Allosphingosinicella sp.]|nr:hypothetical protein [Allosphingosinicella sp.]
MGRTFLFAAAALLVTTAALHAMGQPMVAAWVEGLDAQKRAAVSLVWLTDSLDWTVVAALWALAAWRRERPYLTAAAVATIIPSAMAAGVLTIDPTFFGGWMLAGSVTL